LDLVLGRLRSWLGLHLRLGHRLDLQFRLRQVRLRHNVRRGLGLLLGLRRTPGIRLATGTGALDVAADRGAHVFELALLLHARTTSSRAADLLRRAQLVEERSSVVRVEAEPGGDLLARRLRPLEEESPQALAGLRAAPPVRADLLDEPGAQLRGPNPGAEVVGRVEAGVHVGDESVRAVTDAGGVRELLRVTVRRAAVLGEAAPELELEPELCRVAPVEQGLEEGGRLRVPGRL